MQTKLQMATNFNRMKELGNNEKGGILSSCIFGLLQSSYIVFRVNDADFSLINILITVALAVFSGLLFHFIFWKISRLFIS